MSTEAGYTGADLFSETLERYGVTHVFGNPGTTELPLLRALDGRDVEYVLCLHEDVAVGMAGGYASVRRYHSHADPGITPVGVVNLHLAPGVAHGLGNLYGAGVLGAPVVITAGDYDRRALFEEPVLGGDLVALAGQFAKWSAEVADVESLPAMIRRAFRIALTPPTGPVFLSLPLDVATAVTDARPERLGPIPTAGRGDLEQVERAVDLLVDADDPVLVLGDGVAHAGPAAVDAAVDLAGAAGAPVYAEILASEVDFPADHDLWLSYLPLANDALAREFLDTDTVCFVGCSTNAAFLRLDGDLVSADATCIHVCVDGTLIGRNQPVDAAVVGDPGQVMRQFADRLRERLPEDVRDGRLVRAGERKAAVAVRTEALLAPVTDGPGMSKVALTEAMYQAAPDALVVEEALTSRGALLARWPLGPGQFVSNKGLGLGYGLPAAVGAAIAEAQHPAGRDVIGFVGDGAFLYYPQTLYTAARYGVDLTVVVPNNANYRILRNNYGLMFDDDRVEAMDYLRFDPPVDLPGTAETQGAGGVRVEDVAELPDVLAAALGTPGPVLVDVRVRD